MDGHVEKNKEIEAIWRIDALHKVQKAYPIAFVSIITHCLNGTAAEHSPWIKNSAFTTFLMKFFSDV
ncbi:unnamed protein product [Brassica rapa subsp. trilocularis]